jgi:DNA polymerase V
MPFSIPANDYIDNPLSIDSYLVRDRTASFLLRVAGDAMQRSAICNGDLVLVETSLPVRDNAIVVACIAGEFVLRRYAVQNRIPWLLSENPAQHPIRVREDDDFTLFGVVTAVIRKLKA